MLGERRISGAKGGHGRVCAGGRGGSSIMYALFIGLSIFPSSRLYICRDSLITLLFRHRVLLPPPPPTHTSVLCYNRTHCSSQSGPSHSSWGRCWLLRVFCSARPCSPLLRTSVKGLARLRAPHGPLLLQSLCLRLSPPRLQMSLGISLRCGRGPRRPSVT